MDSRIGSSGDLWAAKQMNRDWDFVFRNGSKVSKCSPSKKVLSNAMLFPSLDIPRMVKSYGFQHLSYLSTDYLTDSIDGLCGERGDEGQGTAHPRETPT